MTFTVTPETVGTYHCRAAVTGFPEVRMVWPHLNNGHSALFISLSPSLDATVGKAEALN
ncbi:hypothetical protein E2C01_101427 [Portunus trituberculatus]|uniref:Uncharacterized protein n=1 Tax=Portunus trituberculatus TaxID=210409 RepID=A0A5B7KKE8_PORTR|nr:hypothetical protein [Portunus trituberculatus]